MKENVSVTIETVEPVAPTENFRPSPQDGAGIGKDE